MTIHSTQTATSIVKKNISELINKLDYIDTELKNISIRFPASKFLAGIDRCKTESRTLRQKIKCITDLNVYNKVIPTSSIKIEKMCADIKYFNEELDKLTKQSQVKGTSKPRYSDKNLSLKEKYETNRGTDINCNKA